MTTPHYKTALMADDDEEDCFIAKETLEETGIGLIFDFVNDGIELLDYLSERALSYPTRLPALILLDLYMPRKDGREALLEIKSDPNFSHIPIVVMTTYQEEKDISFSHKAGADSFITKPDTLSGWVEMMKSVREKWLKQ
jgi:CheY-like chemotaxis protein